MEKMHLVTETNIATMLGGKVLKPECGQWEHKGTEQNYTAESTKC